jgi:CrcB protein
MKTIFWIGLAGAIGAILRTVIGHFVKEESGFPIATFAVNIIGAFLLCLLAAGVINKLSKNKDIQDVITTGFLGSFTTFSALSMETVKLAENGQMMMAFFYVAISIIGGLGAGTIGFRLGQKLVGV